MGYGVALNLSFGLNQVLLELREAMESVNASYNASSEGGKKAHDAHALI